jgi:hypothetical protein
MNGVIRVSGGVFALPGFAYIKELLILRSILKDTFRVLSGRC